MAGRRGGRIRLYFEGESRDAEAAAKRTEAAVDRVEKSTDRYNATAAKQAVAVDRVNERNFKLATSTQRVNRETDTLTKRLQDVNVRFTSMQNIVGLIKLPALATGAGYAAQGLGVAAAGATSLASALAPLSGALAAYPALLGAVGQAAGVVALTQMDDLKEAIGGNEDALKRLSPEAREFIGVFEDMEKPFKRLRSSVQGDLFPGLSRGMRDASKNLPVVEHVMGRTARTMGRLAERAGALLGSKGFGRDFETIGEGNARVLGRMGVAGIKLGSALRHVMVAAQPFLGWLSGSAVKFADWIDGAAKAGRESGRLGAFFGRTKQVMERLASITQSLASGFMGIGKAAAPLGRQILASFDSSAQRFEDWTESMKGKNTLRDYFADAKPTIFEMGRLVRDVAGAFLRLSDDKGIFHVTRAIRVDLLPVLEQLVGTTTRELGTRFVGLFVQLGQMFGTFAGSSGPLTLFLDSLTRMVGTINTLLDTVPGLKTLAVTLIGFGAVSRAMRLTAAATGITSLIGLFKKLRTSALGAAAAETAAARAASFGSVGGMGYGTTTTGGRIARMAGRAQAGAGIGIGGMLIGEQIGGQGGAVVSGASMGAGIGMLAGPAGAVAGGAAGALIGAAVGAGDSIGDKIATAAGESFNENLAPQINRALRRKNVGKLEKLRAALRESINAAIAAGADDASLKPLRDRLEAVGKQIGNVEIPRQDVAGNVDELRSGLITRLKDINSLFRENAANIEEGWRHGGEGWRNATVSSMHAVVAAIRTGMREGTIATEAGRKRIDQLLRNVKLVKGDDPFGIAKGFASGWQKTGQINSQQISRVITDLRRMPKDARETAQDAMISMAQALENKGELVKGSASRLQSALLTKFGKTNERMVQGFGGAVKGIAGLFDSLGGAIATALQGIGLNVNSLLKGLGVNKFVKFGVKVGGAAVDAIGGAVKGVAGLFRAEGGWVNGPSRRDSVLAMLGRDEAVVNVHQQPEVESGLRLQKAMGRGRHGSLNELFAGVRRPNYLATGGYADKIPRPIITGPAPLSTAGQRGVDRVYQGALRYVRKHAKAISPGSIVAIGRQMQSLGYEVGEHPAFGGVSGAHVSSSDHYSDHAVDVNDDAPPYGHGNSEMESLDWLAAQLKRIPHKQIIWRNHDLDTGAVIGNHMDHLHFAAALGGFARLRTFSSGGRVITGRVSYFNGPASTTASGTPVSKPGLALNLAPGTDAGWDNETTRAWMAAAADGHPVFGRTTIAGHTANLPIIDLGPAGSTGRAIDVTESGVRKLGLDPASFPTDSIGKVKILGPGGAGKSKGKSGTAASKPAVGKSFGVSMAPLRPTPLPKGSSAAAKLLPKPIQNMLDQPGLSATEQVEIGQMAMSEAEETETARDDATVAKFLKPFIQKKRNQLQTALKKVNSQLRKGGENEKQREKLLERRNRLQGALGETRTDLRSLNEKITSGRPTARDYADLDLARAESTTDRSDDVLALQKLVTIAQQDLQRAEQSGDPKEIAEATRNLKAAADALREAAPSAEDFANRDLAIAELTAGKEDDRAALLKLKDLAQQQYDLALTTADPRDDIEAAQRLKQVLDALDTTNEILQQREDFEKERLELDKKLVALAETQGPAFMAAFASWIDGAIGGPIQGRSRLATAGVSAGYQ